MPVGIRLKSKLLFGYMWKEFFIKIIVTSLAAPSLVDHFTIFENNELLWLIVLHILDIGSSFNVDV